LTGLIETTADIQSGESGAPLFNADDEVIGIDTAAEVIGGESENGYAIPIDTAMGIVEQIRNGDESDGVVLGYPAFLGVQVQSAATVGSARGRNGSDGTATTGGALISGVVPGSPAQDAGLTDGDTITGIDSTAVSTADALSAALEPFEPGDTVTVTWLDADGRQQSASVTLVEGPAA
jgi:S1-C subfamily serine protease